MNVGKAREKGKVMYNKIRNQNKLKGRCQTDIAKTTGNQVLDSSLYYYKIEHLIQLFLGSKEDF